MRLQGTDLREYARQITQELHDVEHSHILSCKSRNTIHQGRLGWMTQSLRCKAELCIRQFAPPDPGKYV